MKELSVRGLADRFVCSENLFTISIPVSSGFLKTVIKQVPKLQEIPNLKGWKFELMTEE